jgi:hypothetical protein
MPPGPAWHDLVVGSRDWLAGWSPRSSRLLAEAEIATARAALVDTNGDGRELWFGLDVRGPAGEWDQILDWDDVGGQQPVGRLDGHDIVFGWGTGRPRERTVMDYNGTTVRTRVERNGWWLLLASLPTEHMEAEPR